jgi:hypothetical protein
MKTILFILLCFISTPVFADEWTSADSYREAAYLVVDAVDWVQTRNIARNPIYHHENNPILGRHPSVKQVDKYFAFEAIANFGIAYVLPKDWRAGLQYVSIGVEIDCVSHNHKLGISSKF